MAHVLQGAWMRFMYRMQSNGQQTGVQPEPHLGLRPWSPPSRPSKPRLLRHQSAPSTQSLGRSPRQNMASRNSAGNLNTPT